MASHPSDMRQLLRKTLPALVTVPGQNYRARAWESFGPALDKHLAVKRPALRRR